MDDTPTLCLPDGTWTGALCIECGDDDQEPSMRFQKIHHAPSFLQIQSERAVLAEYGGGSIKA